jgi:hypothetical protein
MNRLKPEGRNDIILHVTDEKKNGGQKVPGSDTKESSEQKSKSFVNLIEDKLVSIAEFIANNTNGSYSQGYRHGFIRGLVGHCWHRGISQESTELLISVLVELTHDEESEDRLNIIRETYIRGHTVESEIIGKKILLDIFTIHCNQDKNRAEALIARLNFLIDVAVPTYQKDGSSCTFKNLMVPLDKNSIQKCYDTILKEAKCESKLVKQCFVTLCSMYTKTPMNLNVGGFTGEGKSYVILKVASMFPQEDIIILPV